MTDKRRLVFSIIQFCQKELQSDELSEDNKESLEVCMDRISSFYTSSVFNLNTSLNCRWPASVYNPLTL